MSSIASIMNLVLLVIAIPVGMVSYFYSKRCQKVVDQNNILVARIIERVFAYIIDAVLLLLLASLARYLLDAMRLSILPNDPYIYMVILSILYFPILESSKLQASIGKMILGVKVVSLTGERISFARATARSILAILSSLIVLVGHIVAMTNKANQTMHDSFTKTLVVKGR